MSVSVMVPTPLRKFTNNEETVHVSPGTVEAMVVELEKNHPGISKSLLDATGELRKFVNIYVNEEDIRFLDGKATEIKEGDAVSIVPAIAGG